MRTLVSAVLALVPLAMPAFAEDAAMDPATMTCADFMAMGQDDQMKALDAMAMAGSGGTAATGTAATGTDATETGESATDSDSGTAEDTDAASGGTASMGGMSADQETAMKTACQGDSSMLAMDAMHSAMGTTGATGQ